MENKKYLIKDLISIDDLHKEASSLGVGGIIFKPVWLGDNPDFEIVILPSDIISFLKAQGIL